MKIHIYKSGSSTTPRCFVSNAAVSPDGFQPCAVFNGIGIASALPAVGVKMGQESPRSAQTVATKLFSRLTMRGSRFSVSFR